MHLVTQVRNREAILRAGLVEGRDFTAIDSEALARPLWKLAGVLRMGEGKGWTTVQAIGALSYPYFEHLVWKAFGTRIAAAEFDVVHRVTPLSPTLASPIAAKCRRVGVPFVVGPLNGGVPWPPGFDADRRREREWLSYVRGFYKLLPGRSATLGGGAVIVGSRHTESEVPERFRQRCVYIPENGIDPTRFSKRARHEPGPLRACFIGRMVAYKGPDMLLEAAAPLLLDGRMTLEMIGDGPMLADLVARAAAAGLAPAVRFHGWLPHAEVQNVAAACTALTFPSIREFGGGVVLEAMAMGLAPVIVDYAGPGELVSAGTGFTIPLGRRPEIVRALRATLERLAGDPVAVARAGAAARARVEALFTWDRKAEQIARVYDWVLRIAPRGHFRAVRPGRSPYRSRAFNLVIFAIRDARHRRPYVAPAA